MGMGTERPAFQAVGDGVYAGDVVFAMAGSWRVSLTVSVPGGRAPITRRLKYEVAPGE